MIGPESIYWQATYRCPYCDYPNFLSMEQMGHKDLNKIFCGCGRSFKIDKPELKFVCNDAIISENKVLTDKFTNEIKSILKSQGYSKSEILAAIELASTKKINEIDKLFTDIIPNI